MNRPWNRSTTEEKPPDPARRAAFNVNMAVSILVVFAGIAYLFWKGHPAAVAFLVFIGLAFANLNAWGPRVRDFIKLLFRTTKEGAAEVEASAKVNDPDAAPGEGDVATQASPYGDGDEQAPSRRSTQP